MDFSNKASQHIKPFKQPATFVYHMFFLVILSLEIIMFMKLFILTFLPIIELTLFLNSHGIIMVMCNIFCLTTFYTNPADMFLTNIAH